MAQAGTAGGNYSGGSSKDSTESIFEALYQTLFVNTIHLIKTIGCYLYLIIAIILISLMCLGAVVLVGVGVCSIAGTFFGVLAGLLLFGAILLGPFRDWMSKFTAATKAEFFGV